MKQSFRRILTAASCAFLLAACDQNENQTTQPDETASPASSTSPQRAEPVPQPQTAAEPQPEPTDTLGYTFRVPCDDLSYSLPAAANLLQQLKQAAAARDIRFVEPLIHPNIKFNFGGGGGKQAFMEEWGLDVEPESSDFWIALENMLKIGGFKQEVSGGVTTVVFPCSFRELPKDNWILQRSPQISGFDYMVVITPKAEFTDVDGKPLRKLEMGETVMSANQYDNAISTHDGLEGYVSPNDLRSPLDYRMFLQQQNGVWTIPLFIAGD